VYNTIDKLTPLVILGIPFHNVNYEEALDWASKRMKSGKPGYIATVNVDFIMQAWQDPELQRILIEADLVLADGQPIVSLSKFLGPSLKMRVTGSDITPLLAKRCSQDGLSIYAIGGAPHVAEDALNELARRYPGLKLSGSYSPPMGDLLKMEHQSISKKIADADPSLLLVAFGAPKQEKFINMNIRNWKVPLSIGIGGTLDFITGHQSRAPLSAQKLHLEWLWRMMSNPKRLFKRYALNIFFLLKVTIRLMFIKYYPYPTTSMMSKRDEQRSQMFHRILKHSKEIRHLTYDVPKNSQNSSFNFFEPLFNERFPSSIVLDMKSRDWLDSKELGYIMNLTRFCRHREGRLYLVNLSTRLFRLLLLYRMHNYCTLCCSIDEVIEKQFRLKRLPNTLYQSFPVELTSKNIESFITELKSRFSTRRYDQIILDALHLEYLDSIALLAILEFSNFCGTQNIKLRLNNIHGAVQNIFNKSNFSIKDDSGITSPITALKAPLKKAKSFFKKSAYSYLSL
jgi:N-acetylglucosaminyldiphosphoundecaprenol N-acetyl-beta-D-mannosaminyltransferase